ncbi:hypothetical protein HW561_07990 [Rhodobacteraceae bacterium B1Z28]|uniref:CENP-V/GFA domain-containing protein n=1 Tax=Ruegeria haliotis TaxID=2747601 RepID=A0ABX2PR91_9RHOB|nr:DUF6151 family protein [Ruegeria haliotis]NVO55727.1 hypothetical protein [Ruegeria haliotis]
MGENAPSDLAFSCTCGSLKGRITAKGAKSGTHVACFCQDCRAAQLYFGQPDPAPGPVEILQITPEEIEIETGLEHLAVMRLSPRGMLRWYANCCNAPLATTSRTPKFPFAGFILQRITNPQGLGPITTRGFVPQPNGKQKHERLGHAIFGMLNRVARSRLSGSWKNTPFFNHKTSEPVVTPTVISKSERAALYH